MATHGMRARLRTVPGNAVSALNHVVRGADWTSQWCGQPWQLRLSVEDAQAAVATDILVALSWNDIHACLALSHANTEALFAARYGLLATAELADDLLLALLQDTADTLAEGFPPQLSGAIRIDGWRDLDAAAAMPFIFALQMTPAAGEPLSCHLLADLPNLRKLAARCGRTGGTRMLAHWAGMRVAVTLELGWVDLRMDQLASAKLQDVLIPDGWWHARDQRGMCIRISPMLGIEARMADDNLLQATTKVKSMEQEPSAHSGDEAPSVSEVGLSDLADVPLRITFDVGERHLTLRELAGVAPGYVFDLGLAPERAVNLRINGVRIGEGELVDIDGRIGVAITRITAPRP